MTCRRCGTPTEAPRRGDTAWPSSRPGDDAAPSPPRAAEQKTARLTGPGAGFDATWRICSTTFDARSRRWCGNSLPLNPGRRRPADALSDGDESRGARVGDADASPRASTTTRTSVGVHQGVGERGGARRGAVSVRRPLPRRICPRTCSSRTHPPGYPVLSGRGRDRGVTLVSQAHRSSRRSRRTRKSPRGTEMGKVSGDERDGFSR